MSFLNMRFSFGEFAVAFLIVDQTNYKLVRQLDYKVLKRFLMFLLLPFCQGFKACWKYFWS